jgi:hypothetical protein
VLAEPHPGHFDQEDCGGGSLIDVVAVGVWREHTESSALCLLCACFVPTGHIVYEIQSLQCPFECQ